MFKLKFFYIFLIFCTSYLMGPAITHATTVGSGSLNGNTSYIQASVKGYVLATGGANIPHGETQDWNLLMYTPNNQQCIANTSPFVSIAITQAYRYGASRAIAIMVAYTFVAGLSNNTTYTNQPQWSTKDNAYLIAVHDQLYSDSETHGDDTGSNLFLSWNLYCLPYPSQDNNGSVYSGPAH